MAPLTCSVENEVFSPSERAFSGGHNGIKGIFGKKKNDFENE